MDFELDENNPPKIPFGTNMETMNEVAPNVLMGSEDIDSDAIGSAPVNSTLENFTANFINTTWIFGPTEDKVILPLLLSLIALGAFLANGLIIFTVLAYRKMRTGPYLMLMNIAVADMVFAAFCIPTAIINHSVPGENDPIDFNICKFVHYVIFVTVYVGIYTLMVTCMFRFFAEFLSTKFHQLLSKTNAVVSNFVIWLAFSISHLNFIMQEDTAIFQEPFICIQTDLIIDQNKTRTLWITFLACAFLVPLVLIFILSAITMHLQRRHKPTENNTAILNENGRGGQEDRIKCEDSSKSHRELTMMVMASMIVRTLCWLPIQIFVMIDIFGMVDSTDLYRKAEMLAVCCAFIGSCVSVLVYSCVSGDFRSSFQETTSCFLSKKGEPEKPPPVDYKIRSERDVHVNETIMSILTDSSNHINYA